MIKQILIKYIKNVLTNTMLKNHIFLFQKANIFFSNKTAFFTICSFYIHQTATLCSKSLIVFFNPFKRHFCPDYARLQISFVLFVPHTFKIISMQICQLVTMCTGIRLFLRQKKTQFASSQPFQNYFKRLITILTTQTFNN